MSRMRLPEAIAVFLILWIVWFAESCVAAPISAYPLATGPMNGTEVTIGNQSGITKQFPLSLLGQAAQVCSPGTIATLPQQGFTCTAAQSTYALPTTLNFQTFRGTYTPSTFLGWGYNTSVAKSNYWGTDAQTVYYSQGQHVGAYFNMVTLGLGDTLGLGVLQQSEGGSNATTDEGLEPVEFASMQGDINFVSTVNGTVVAPTSITLNTPSSPTAQDGQPTQGDGRYLMDVTAADACASANTITTIGAASNAITQMTMSGTCSASSAHTTASPINVPNTQNGTSVNFVVGNSAGFSAPGVITIADALAYETATITAVPDSSHITALVHKPHSNGATVAQGGEAGKVLVLTPDIFTATGQYGYWNVSQSIPLGLPIAYSDSTHLFVWISIDGVSAGYTGQATVSAGSNAFNIYPAAEVLDVTNNTSAVGLTWTLAPNTWTWTSGDTVNLPPYPYAKQSFGQWYIARTSPALNVAPQNFAIRYAGYMHDGDTMLQLNNGGISSQYAGLGGGKFAKPHALVTVGPVQDALKNINYPDVATIYQAYDATVGLPTDYRLFRADNSDLTADIIGHNVSTKQWFFAAGGNTVFYFMSPTAFTGPAVVATTFVTATQYLRMTPVTLAQLNTNDPSPAAGDRGVITDATSCTFMGSITGGGSSPCPVIRFGSGWFGG